jgi:hypothetical protein
VGTSLPIVLYYILDADLAMKPYANVISQCAVYVRYKPLVPTFCLASMAMSCMAMELPFLSVVKPARRLSPHFLRISKPC